MLAWAIWRKISNPKAWPSFLHSPFALFSVETQIDGFLREAVRFVCEYVRAWHIKPDLLDLELAHPGLPGSAHEESVGQCGGIRRNIQNHGILLPVRCVLHVPA